MEREQVIKVSREEEMIILEHDVKPMIQEARECLRAGKQEELETIVLERIVGRLVLYRDTELERYENSPDSLKSAPKVDRMMDNASMYNKAIKLLFDEKEDKLRPFGEKELDEVERLVVAVLKS